MQPDHEPGGASRSRSETNTLLSSADCHAGFATPGPDETEATKFGWLGSSETVGSDGLRIARGTGFRAGDSKYGDVNDRRPGRAYHQRPQGISKRPRGRVQMGADQNFAQQQL